MAGIRSFTEVFESEAVAVNARRRKAGALPKPNVSILSHQRPATPPNELGERARPAPGHGLFGLALSGGGVRSASFCLGALQGIDAACPDDKPQILDEVDYLSTVSGGGYMGIGLVSALMQSDGRFPFVSKIDQEETLATKQLRDYSNYLMPNGPSDVVIGALAVIRGLIVNVFVFLSIILLAAGVTIAINPDRESLTRAAFPNYVVPPALADNVFAWTITSGFVLGALVLFHIVLLPWIFVAIGTFSRNPCAARPSLTWRIAGNCTHYYVTVLWILIFFFEVQAYVLSGVFDSRHLAGSGRNHVALLIEHVSEALKGGWPAILAAITGLVGSVSKLTSLVKTTSGDQSWSGSFRRWGSLALIYLAAAVAPLLIWAAYLALSYWGIANVVGEPVVDGDARYVHAPAWLNAAASHAGVSHAKLYLGLGLLGLIVSLFVRPNAGSLHGYYRDRLSRAFLWDAGNLKNANSDKKAPAASDSADRLSFSGLKRPDDPSVAFAPYLLVNTAVNLGGSRDLNRRGRNADSFIFSPHFAGSEATGYIKSSEMEQRDPAANLGTAMAASGAAASANMGASTIMALTFTLSALNVRLGYWIFNPKMLDSSMGWWRSRWPGIWYFFREAFGLIGERDRYVYLTDGGHYDNLALYELLKRRCRVILAIDAEADPLFHFDSLVRLQRYARIDLGVRIDLPWPKLKEQAVQITAECPTGSPSSSFRRNGPHVAIGRIRYSEAPDDIGVLIYCKSSLSGDENDLLRDYKRRNGDFPHETTVDQFFTEEQFEVYRSLGFHMTNRFLRGEDRATTITPQDDPDWWNTVCTALERIAVQPECIAKIMRNLVS